MTNNNNKMSGKRKHNALLKDNTTINGREKEMRVSVFAPVAVMPPPLLLPPRRATTTTWSRGYGVVEEESRMTMVKQGHPMMHC